MAEANGRLADAIRRYGLGEVGAAEVVEARRHGEAVRAAEQDLRAAERQVEVRAGGLFDAAAFSVWEWLCAEVAGLVAEVEESLDGLEPGEVWGQARPLDWSQALSRCCGVPAR